MGRVPGGSRAGAAGMSTLFVFGLGYTALRLAERMRARGWHVIGTVRRRQAAAELRSRDIEVLLFDGTAPSAAVSQALADATHVLSSVPPDAGGDPDVGGDPVLRCHERALMAAPRLMRLAYLSTIGVYGDRQGGWVDENHVPEPPTARAAARVAAEAAWLALRERVPVQVFRLGGIYGPGRNALRAVADGTARRISKPGQVFNRIHVDDIARLLEAAMTQAPVSTIYNVVDDAPSSPEEPVLEAARLLGVPPPPAIPFESANLGPMARSFYAGNRRVSNARIKRELGVTLLYPSVRDGLRALHAAGEGR